MPIVFSKALARLLAAFLGCFILVQTGDQFFHQHWTALLALSPSRFFGEYFFWQIFTYPLVSKEPLQFIFDLMLIAWVGSELENLWGFVTFLAYFIGCSVFAGFIFY